ncbi:hypothetical protein FOXB_17223 [Fusarium oxysporum f. sp. conglutinans Fo5176]|uniref:Uncharacterized protein n=1 Tax=Fusarium oxysporum (strain Fo5176) TaxID=660025 RepID=F9GEY9_FUSOF|nr:hypothetical protein FOXB_17223 [Fusarium oxysporum f. sp. conglutinans Fo5176]
MINNFIFPLDPSMEDTEVIQ